MSASVYTINKGVNRPVEFRGLKAQYIWWLAGGVIALTAVFAVLYIVGVNPFLCIGVVGVGGFVLFWQVYRCSRLYGVNGWMKRSAARKLPVRITAESRRVYYLAR